MTTVRPDVEVEPHRLGLRPEAIAGIWSAVEGLYRTGVHPALQLCVRHRGEVLLDRAIGHASGNGPDEREEHPVPVTPDTPINVFSVAKSITALLIHRLDELGHLHVDDPVAEYLPEFARHGKERITLRHLLSHRAGIPSVPAELWDLDLLERPDAIVGALCELRPSWRAGKVPAYHALGGGYLLAEIAERVSGQDVRTWLDRWIAGPLGLRWMSYGVAERDVPAVARNYFTGPPALPPLSQVVRRAVGIDLATAAELSNDPRFLTAVVPSGNVVTTATDLARLYQLLLDGGELDGVRLLEPRTLRRATAAEGWGEPDRMLGLPIPYALGFMLGHRRVGLFGPATEGAFGHLGLINILCWADPTRDVAVALLNTGKPLGYVHVYHLWEFVRRVADAFPRRGRTEER